jgi:5-methylcytosine-specific restriction protein A
MTWSNRSRQSRGYGAAWDKLRLAVLKRDHYVCQCSECKAQDRVTPATEVDHRIPKAQGGTDDPSNLQAINAVCHQRKTQAETGRPLKPRRRYDASGHRIATKDD